MALNKYKLGQLIKLSEEINENNVFGISDVRGISIKKEFIETKADMEGVSLRPYLLVKSNYFAYVTITSRNGEKISLAYNTSGDTHIVSSSYVVFYVKECELLLPEYLFIFFNRPEFDRYSRFNSWGSAREAFSWEEMCDIDIELPPIEVQQKYVDIYQGMVKNQQAYERGLEDLKLVCDSYFDVAKKRYSCLLGCLIEKVDERNSNSLYFEKDVRGINNKKEFSKTKADISTADLSKFKVVRPHQFAYNSRTDGRDMLVLALNREETPIIVTFNYNVFKIRQEKSFLVDVNYLYAFFKRAEFDRRVRFNSWGSSQELLSWDNLCNIEVPLPNIEEQKSLAEIINLYIERKEINEKLKSQIKAICPILIKGSLNDGRG